MAQEKKGIPFLYFYPGTTVKCGFKLVSYKFAKGGFVSKEKVIEGEGTVICTTIQADSCDVQHPEAINLLVKLEKYYLLYDITKLLSLNNNLPGNGISFDSSKITVEVFGKGINKNAKFEPILNVVNPYSKILWTKDQNCIDVNNSEVYLHKKYDIDHRLNQLSIVLLHTVKPSSLLKPASLLITTPSINMTKDNIDEFIIDYNGNDYTLQPSLGLLPPTSIKKDDVFRLYNDLYQVTIVENPDVSAEYEKRCEILKNMGNSFTFTQKCKNFFNNLVLN